MIDYAPIDEGGTYLLRDLRSTLCIHLHLLLLSHLLQEYGELLLLHGRHLLQLLRGDLLQHLNLLRGQLLIRHLRILGGDHWLLRLRIRLRGRRGCEVRLRLCEWLGGWGGE